MTQEDKDLLLKDLCQRLPYGVKITDGLSVINVDSFISIGVFVCDGKWKPYLRPMSSMTEEEYKELKLISPYYGFAPYEFIGDWCPNYDMVDWLNAHHFDYRGLIPKGLAIEAPKGMYSV